MSNGDTIFSPATLGMAQRNVRNFPGDIGADLRASDEQTLNFLGGLEKTFRRYAIQKGAEERRHRSSTFIAATNVAQKRFDLDLKRELAHFYTSDGRDLNPPSDYEKDLGFGVRLSPGDFKSREGQRRSFTDIVDYMHSRFSEARKKTCSRCSNGNTGGYRDAEGETSIGHFCPTIPGQQAGAYSCQQFKHNRQILQRGPGIGERI